MYTGRARNDKIAAGIAYRDIGLLAALYLEIPANTTAAQRVRDVLHGQVIAYRPNHNCFSLFQRCIPANVLDFNQRDVSNRNISVYSFPHAQGRGVSGYQVRGEIGY